MQPIAAGSLPAYAPFDFAKTLAFLGMFPPTQREQRIADGTLTKATHLAGQTVIFRGQAAQDEAAAGVDYALYAEAPLDAGQIARLEDRIAFFLSLGDDLGPFYAVTAQDAPFAPVLERLYGYHQVKFLTPFENACWAILSQRTSIPQTRTVKQRLMARYVDQATLDGDSYLAFPEPETLAQASLPDLATLTGHERKAAYLHAASKAFTEADEGWLRNGPYAEVEAWLRAIPGIGPWSAAFILIRGLGRMDRISLTERRLIEAVGRVYGAAHTSDEAVLALAARYGPWQGYWAHYLRAAG
jgi:DNA-3-methyladenine glycosylase II